MNNDLFGKINNPSGTFGSANPAQDLGNLIGTGINLFLVVLGLTAFIYMMWGAFNWVTSSGDKDKLQKAQGKIRNAVIGILLSVGLLVLFNVIFGIVLGGRIIDTSGGTIKFKLPSLQNQAQPGCDRTRGPC